jgi:RNA polymerase sigma-70 factor (ECF subfamily)
MSEDRQLVAGLNRGEPAALRRIYLKYKDDLLNVARSLVWDLNTAEDCLHDVFVALASDGCRIRSNLKGYLLTSVVNRARDHLRRRAAGHALHVHLQSQPHALTDRAHLQAPDDRIDIVMRALEVLPAEQREVIALHLQGDMKFRQIAAMLDLSINTVQSRYRYGMERLLRLVKQKEAI